MKNVFAIALLAAAAPAMAHIRLTQFNGNSACVRLPPNNSPVEDVNSANIVCNVNGNTPAASLCSVAAGSTATVTWDTGAHPGPGKDYLPRQTSDAKTTNPASLSWFKISQDGLRSDGKWGSDYVNSAGGKYSFKIPSNIAAGQYLLRGETIGLHVAQNYPGAQFYMGCAQLNITGGGSANPSGVKFPGAYKGTDSGIKINIYYPVPTSYTTPGPSVYSG
ncbi:glycoside hydrolase family 61 protein [Botryobasidium botryosum FD-172 SS1]|uniref:AA9 family lytic polysaccharide monooxygenase n=1 Tax=Botryobasidium botryosum (strain FD-172 SS1) TaxID=930990 RepID=A0A067M9A9_BOTB1|nr:glycoside hydrolase family 61 protein [Botryobasidium botryosum FD-172 SS1]